MNRVVFYVFVALLTFTIGISAVFWLVTRQSPINQPSPTVHPAPKTLSSSDKLRPPRSFGSFQYRSTTWITTTTNCFPEYWFTAPDSSNIYLVSYATEDTSLKDILDKAEQVVEHTSVFDEQGNPMGERVVILNTADSIKHESRLPVWLAWTERGKFFKVSGYSVQRVLAFEKAFREAY